MANADLQSLDTVCGYCDTTVVYSKAAMEHHTIAERHNVIMTYSSKVTECNHAGHHTIAE